MYSSTQQSWLLKILARGDACFNRLIDCNSSVKERSAVYLSIVKREMFSISRILVHSLLRVAYEMVLLIETLRGEFWDCIGVSWWVPTTRKSEYIRCSPWFVWQEILNERIKAFGTVPSESTSSCKFRGLFGDEFIDIAEMRWALLRGYVCTLSTQQLCHLYIVGQKIDSIHLKIIIHSHSSIVGCCGVTSLEISRRYKHDIHTHLLLADYTIV